MRDDGVFHREVGLSRVWGALLKSLLLAFLAWSRRGKKRFVDLLSMKLMIVEGCGEVAGY